MSLSLCEGSRVSAQRQGTHWGLAGVVLVVVVLILLTALIGV